MTSRQYDDFCRVNTLLKSMRKEDLSMLSYALMVAKNQENNKYIKENLDRLLLEVDKQIDSCIVD